MYSYIQKSYAAAVTGSVLLFGVTAVVILLTYTADTQAEGVGRFSGTDQLIVQFSDNKQFPSSRVLS